MVPQVFISLQEAVNHALDGDTITVAPGVYFEGCSVFSSSANNLYIKGAGGFGNSVSVLQGNCNSDCFIIAKSHNIEISGFEIRKWKDGVAIYHSDTVSVHDNYIHNLHGYHSEGVFIEYSTEVTVKNNVIDNVGYINVYICQQNQNVLVINNTLVNNTAYHGIQSRCGNQGIRIINNIIAFNQGNGVHFIEGQGDAVIEYNCCYNNGIDWKDCIPGKGNFSLDPKFRLKENNMFHLSITSSCIDTGSPDILDDDGSNSDIGANF
ncbi:MAG: right-handed parallel beta-helix repeat-containing protein [FCB group bacterium]|nr:right-handed parallel beta-helix repeat-containing protein [FCB group bacterium]